MQPFHSITKSRQGLCVFGLIFLILVRILGPRKYDLSKITERVTGSSVSSASSAHLNHPFRWPVSLGLLLQFRQQQAKELSDPPGYGEGFLFTGEVLEEPEED